MPWPRRRPSTTAACAAARTCWPWAACSRPRWCGASSRKPKDAALDARDAERLIAAAVPPGPGTWADFGAGDGTFTRALATRLGRGARIFAVDRDARALAALERELEPGGADVTTVRADLSQPLALKGAQVGTLDGLLLANTLHFLPDHADVLARLARWLRPGGVAVIVEYDRRSPSRWVPHPVDAADLPALFAAATLTPPRIVARVDSAFGGEMVVAVGQKGG